MTILRHTLFATFSMLALAGCAAHADGPPAPSAEPQAACVVPSIQPGAWFEPASAKTLSTPEALMRLRDARVVLLGETHVIADHHRWHMQTVAQLYAQHPDMILGFEAFPRRVQAVLDRWVAGELTEAEFLKQSEWETVWRYDANLYLPLFHFARLNRIPMVALNVDRTLIRKVSEHGWKNVPISERLGVGDPAPASNGYIAMLGHAYGQHENGDGETNGAPKAPGLDDPHFAGFVDVQLTWDRAMAEAAASALQTARSQGRDPQLVAVIGSGHMDFGFGVPHQLSALGIDKVKVLTPWDQMRPCAELGQNPPPADLVYGLAVTADYLPKESDGPKLGVLIEAAEGGVRVKEVLDDSLAKTAGLLMNDLITHAAGQSVATSGELVTIIKGMNPGTWLPLTVRRGGKTMEIVARFPAAKP